jgi:plasmid stabilization system protein ParE
MGLTVQYTETFEVTFRALVKFIQEKWGDKAGDDFIEETDKIIQLISRFPRMYKSSMIDKEVRVAQINKLSFLFYEVTQKHITLLYIVDCRQDPFWL